MHAGNEGIEGPAECAGLQSVQSFLHVRPHDPARPQVPLPKTNADRLENELHALPGFLEHRFGRAQPPPLCGFPDLSLDRGYESRQTLFDDEIARACSQKIDGGFLGDRARDHNARHIWAVYLKDIQNVVRRHRRQ
jgi:hypothetical protein